MTTTTSVPLKRPESGRDLWPNHDMKCLFFSGRFLSREAVLAKLSTLVKLGLQTYELNKPEPKRGREDARKLRFMNESSITLEMGWRGSGQPFVNELRVLLSHGRFAAPCNPRVMLWQRRDSDFTPLWTSPQKHHWRTDRDNIRLPIILNRSRHDDRAFFLHSSVKMNTQNPQYKEQTDLKIEFVDDEGPKRQWSKTKKEAGIDRPNMSGVYLRFSSLLDIL